MFEIRWCNHCDLPFLGNKCGICKSQGVRFRKVLKPIFPAEAKLFIDNLIAERKINKNLLFSKLLFRSRNFIVDGKGTLGKITIPEFESLKFIVNKKRLDLTYSFSNCYDEKIQNWNQSTSFEKRLVKASVPFLKKIEKEAIEFIKKDVGFKYPWNENTYFISFSGGKDSTVVANLVKKALPEKKIPLLFINTTIELPQTIEFSHTFSKWIDLQIIEVKAQADFFELCKELGPPSRMMRWCCTTQKGSSVNDFYKKFGLKASILSFDGIRKDESNLRKDYPRIKKNTKMTKQISVYPILEWNEFAVWLYILWQKIPFNDAYLRGYSRIGCWACPNNTKLDWIFSKTLIPRKYEKWKQFLIQFANNNEKDMDWIYNGLWKSRKSKYIFTTFVVKESPCSLGNDVVYTFKEPINRRFAEFMKIFGTFKQNGRMIHIHGPYVKIFFMINGSKMYVKFNTKELPEHYKYRFEVQIRRALNCVECGGCIGVCFSNAISIIPEFRIDEDRCNGCLICATSKWLKQSCVALHYNTSRKIIKDPFEFHHITPGSNPFKGLYQFSPVLARKLGEMNILSLEEFMKIDVSTLEKKTGITENKITRGKTIVEAFLDSKIIPFNGGRFKDILNKYNNYVKMFTWFNFESDELKSIFYCILDDKKKSEEITIFELTMTKFRSVLTHSAEPTALIFFEKNPKRIKEIEKVLKNKPEYIKFFNLYKEIRDNFAIPIKKKSGNFLNIYYNAMKSRFMGELKRPKIQIKMTSEEIGNASISIPQEAQPLIELYTIAKNLLN